MERRSYNQVWPPKFLPRKVLLRIRKIKRIFVYE